MVNALLVIGTITGICTLLDIAYTHYIKNIVIVEEGEDFITLLDIAYTNYIKNIVIVREEDFITSWNNIHQDWVQPTQLAKEIRLAEQTTLVQIEGLVETAEDRIVVINRMHKLKAMENDNA